MTLTSSKPVTEKKGNFYTWKEIEKHNKHDDCWLAIDDIVYDVSKFALSHPGGDIILLGGGTDASIMFSSYHVNGINPKILEKYAIGKKITKISLF